MENTSNYVEGLHEKQQKDEQNRQHQGKGNPGKKKPNKTHK
ncbi:MULTISPECIES: DUF4023 domain-containing protein [Metabacillus]|jgi:hypothetical protein|uniref:DUF4023 domain-containing protein n=1 Tax=Metabacillus hrfriensis TaxID=3048891 RepID=A0ACD4R600_9BACI|nr:MULTISPECIES: DUF4023 domain-containing protein [Metabacillus]UAL50416.1 DUF4023 domain-containing protein [Metabacillus dongyingensis]UOK56520.1 DUF4023 domain-containing protein [Bacillus sp. OVS6]USK26674.1 DUF4023 domain-containing protein [Bacillus sp. CMF21]WHZ55895.1 DUF4023 domain-containing protein [Metabacillus sp. CT-WN-B3]